MRKLIDSQHIEMVKYEYDSLTEWNTDFNVMITKGWKDVENYFDYETGKYIQVYSKEIN